jgi:hypothetical protein
MVAQSVQFLRRHLQRVQSQKARLVAHWFLTFSFQPAESLTRPDRLLAIVSLSAIKARGRAPV